MIEEWRDIKGYEGLYQVSNTGKVRSKERVLRLVKNRGGYLVVNLCKDGKRKMFLVHRLVAEAFIPNIDNKHCINHKDEDKQNNNVFNLEWCDYKYNNNYGTHNERMSKTLTNREDLSKPVLQFKNGVLIREWSSMMECKRNGFIQQNVSKCCNGERYTHRGFVWKYK